MHEFCVASSLLDLVGEHVPEAERPLVRAVRVRVGALSGVAVEALRFSFDALVRGTPWEGARLDVEVVPASARCPACGAEHEMTEPAFACPDCGGARLHVEGGADLQLREIALEEPRGEGP